MKKKNLVKISGAVIAVIVAVTAGGLLFTKAWSKEEGVEEKLDLVIATIEEEDLEPIVWGDMEVDYADYTDSIDNMKEEADLIIRGRVSDQEQSSSMAVRSTVEVLKTYKGEECQQIYTVQTGTIGHSGVMGKGSEYILFLGKQGKEENTYFVKGGTQGEFSIIEDNIIAVDSVMREELETMKGEKGEDFSIETFENWISGFNFK